MLKCFGNVGMMRVETRRLHPAEPLIGQLMGREFLFFPGHAAVDNVDVTVMLGLFDLAAHAFHGLHVFGRFLGAIKVHFVPVGQLIRDDFGMLMTLVIVAVIVLVFSDERRNREQQQSSCTQGGGENGREAERAGARKANTARLPLPIVKSLMELLALIVSVLPAP